MDRHLTVLLALLFPLVFTPRAYPSPVEINVLNNQSSVGFGLSRYVPPVPDGGITNFFRTLNAAAPVSDSITTNPFTGTETFLAGASADRFSVYAFSPAPYDADPMLASVQATATNEVWFAPVTTETTTLTLLFSADGHWWDCTSGELSLVNLTTGDEVWDYEWSGTSGTVAGVPVLDLGFGQVATLLELQTAFIGANIYKLSMHTETYAGSSPKSPTVSLQLFGLEPIPSVPEPATLSLVGFGALALALARRRK
jgi:hypothetical protein